MSPLPGLRARMKHKSWGTSRLPLLMLAAALLLSRISKGSMPEALDDLWELGSARGSVDHIVPLEGGQTLVATARGWAMLVNDKGGLTWSRRLGDAWLLPPVPLAKSPSYTASHRVQFSGVLQQNRWVAFGVSSTLVEELLPNLQSGLASAQLPLSNGSVVFVLGPKLLGYAGANQRWLEAELALPIKAVFEAKSGLVVVDRSGTVFALSPAGGLRSVGKTERPPTHVGLAGEDTLLLTVQDAVVAIEIGRRKATRFAVKRAGDEAAFSTSRSGGFALLGRDGTLEQYDRRGSLLGRLPLLPQGVTPRQRGSYQLQSNQDGAVVALTPEGRIVLVSPRGEVIAERQAPCAPTSLALSQRAVLLGCTDGKLLCLGSRPSPPGPPQPSRYNEPKKALRDDFYHSARR
jgi:hypothetical protein